VFCHQSIVTLWNFPLTADTGRKSTLDRLGERTARVLRQIGPWRLLASALFAVLALVVARFGWSLPIISGAERALYDVRSTVTAPAVGEDSRIALVVYDTQTLANTDKRSPLDRALLAKALTRLDAMGPKAIGIDILIGQPQSEDEQLIAALRSLRTPTWLAFGTSASMPDSLEPSEERYLRVFLARLPGSRVSPASANIDLDSDGVVRHWPKRAMGAPALLPLALSAADPGAPGYDGGVIFRRPAFADKPVFAKAPIYLFSPGATSEAADQGLARFVRGKLVLIGADLPYDDRFATPATAITGADASGLEVQASLLAQALDGQRLTAIPAWCLWIAATIVVLTGALTGAADIRRWWIWPATLAQIALLIATPFFLQSRGLDTRGLPMFGWMVGWAITVAAVAGAARSIGAEQRQFAHSALGKYLPRDIANEILRNPDRLNLSGERLDLYVIFTDLEGFTETSHMMEPEAVGALVNRYLALLSEVVLQHGGTIDKFVGDSVVAFWGAPIARPDDADRAVSAALALHQIGEDFRRQASEDLPPLGRTRIGLHRGPAIVGNFGGEGRFQYTAFGDSMNTASRLEAANKQLRSDILVSASVAERSSIDGFRPLGRVILRGRSTPIEVIELKPEFPESARRRLDRAYARFEAGDTDALAEMASLADDFPEDAALWNFVERLRAVGPGGAFPLS